MSKRLVILGAGESGVGAAILAQAQGYDVFVSDAGVIAPAYKTTLVQHGIDWEAETHSEARVCTADVVVKSPGIPDTAPIITVIKKAGIPILSEIEFASKHTDATLIAITGSNGKTTTASLTYELLKHDLDVGLAGNIGTSFAKQVATRKHRFYVLEVSSFQLDDIHDFHPKIAIITNITPDHLDRYNHRFEDYVVSKFRITKNQTSADYLIYDADDAVISKYLKTNPTSATKVPFSIQKKVTNGLYLEEKTIVTMIDKNHTTMPTETLALEGKHNVKNAMAASAVAHLLKIRKQTIRKSLENFHGVEHRLENVLKINKVQYINDSKATNVNATYYALESMNAPTVWIVGGEDKGNNYSELFPFVNEKVKAIICLGIDNEKLINTFAGVVDIMVETQFMSEAVKIAYRVAQPGENVLLSPACASFDLFKNYKERGQQFKEAVRAL